MGLTYLTLAYVATHLIVGQIDATALEHPAVAGVLPLWTAVDIIACHDLEAEEGTLHLLDADSGRRVL
ncbi:MAG: hypothetical protein GIW94_02100 [Candidatus Eremiobacteraeota bacterium]|nr:hypothetical protein [Candidatus Eremiobacteraeota bacterium]